MLFCNHCKYLIVICLAFWTLTLSSCNDHQDTVRPVISVISPLSTLSVTVPDSVLLVAEISDNSTIEFVEVTVVNADRIRVGEETSYRPGNSLARIEQYVRFKDKSMDSGDYFILVYASDGVQSKSAYIPVSVHEIPRELLGFCIVSEPTGASSAISYLDASFQFQRTVNTDLKYLHSGIDSKHGLFYLVSGASSVVLAYPLDEDVPKWSRYAGFPTCLYSALFVDDDVILGTFNGDVWVLDHNGQVKANSQPDLNRKVHEVSANKDYIVGEMTDLSEARHFLASFYRSSCYPAFSNEISGDISSLVPQGQGFLVFCNSGAKAIISYYDPYSGLSNNLAEKDPMAILGACPGPDGKVFYWTGEEVYLYDYESNTSLPFAVVEADGMTFDPLNRILYYFDWKGVGKLAYPSGIDLGYEEVDPSVAGFHLIYNR